MAGSARLARLTSQLQRCVAERLRRGVKDPRVGQVTVTAVELAADMSHARVLVLPFGATAAEPMLAGLRSASGFLRGEVGRELGLRHAPRLDFELDAQFEQAQRLSTLIDAAVESDRSRTEPPAGR